MSWITTIANAAKKILNIPPTIILPEQLQKVADTLSFERCKQMATLLNEYCDKYGVKTKDEFHEFLANVIQESGEFAHKTENMNYKAETLMKVWPQRFPTLQQAEKYAHNPQALANKVYGFRMGNRLPDDGWRFRGGGHIGLTGREVYTKYAAYIGLPVEQAADLVRTTDQYALDSAFWFFYVLKGLKKASDNDDIMGIIKSVNGGFIGKEVRLMYYERAKKYVV